MTNYEILGVSPNDNEEVIKQAYRRLSKKYHPDIIGGDGKKFMQIKDAYEELMKQCDPSRREQPSIVFTHHMYDKRNNTMDLHITHSNDFIFAEGTFGNKSCTWTMMGKTHSIFHITADYMRPSFKVRFVNKDYSSYTKHFDFDLPKYKKEKKADIEIKSDSSCLGCISQIVIIWLLIEAVKYLFNLN